MRKFSRTIEITTSDTKIDLLPHIVTRLELRDLEVPLDTLAVQPSELQGEAIRTSIAANSELLGDVNDVLWHDALTAAQRFAQVALSRYEETRQHLAEVRDQLRQSKQANYLCLTLSLLFGLMVLVGDYALTWSTLPALLTIEKTSLLGLALGGIPVAAAMVLEAPLRRLFELVTHTNQTSRRWQAVTLGMEVMFILGILWSNYAMVRSLAPAREEAAKIMQCLESGACVGATVNQEITYQAILAVSLVVVLDAALFFLTIDEEYRRMTRWLGLKREQKQSRHALEARENSLSEAKRAEDRASHIWDTRQGRKDALAKAMKSRVEFLLAGLAAAPIEKPKELREIVEELLTPYTITRSEAPISRRNGVAGKYTAGMKNESEGPQCH
jgi:hypothetical protein